VRDTEPAPLLESPPTSGLSAVAPRGTFIGELLVTLDRSNIPLLASALTFDAILAIIPFSILLIAGLGLLLTRTEYFGMLDPGALISNFLPDHGHGDPADPFALVEGLLGRSRASRAVSPSLPSPPSSGSPPGCSAPSASASRTSSMSAPSRCRGATSSRT
jgi:hypothetical protein